MENKVGKKKSGLQAAKDASEMCGVRNFTVTQRQTQMKSKMASSSRRCAGGRSVPEVVLGAEPGGGDGLELAV